MTKISKRHTDNKDLVDAEKKYDLEEAITILKDATNAKFEESIDVAINLGKKYEGCCFCRRRRC